MTHAGNALPWLALAGSAVGGVRRQRSAALAHGLRGDRGWSNRVSGGDGPQVRGRPRAAGDNVSVRDFKPFSSTSGFDAFPSRHTAVMWAVATPFALEYNAPCLYGVAALSKFARVGSREHWFSDTVAGSAIGRRLGVR